MSAGKYCDTTNTEDTTTVLYLWIQSMVIQSQNYL